MYINSNNDNKHHDKSCVLSKPLRLGTNIVFLRCPDIHPTLPDHVEIFDLQFNGRIIKINFGEDHNKCDILNRYVDTKTRITVKQTNQRMYRIKRFHIRLSIKLCIQYLRYYKSCTLIS